MAYTSGLLKDRVTILRKQQDTSFGGTTSYEAVMTVWAQVTWLKGMKRLAEATLDAQDTVVVRMRWNSILTRDCRLKHGDTIYQIQSLHPNYQDNTIQVTATEVV